MNGYHIKYMNTELEIEITRLNPEVPLPKYETVGSVAFDIAAFEDKTILPSQIVLIRTGLIISVPSSYCLLLASRSSGPNKLGIAMPHGIGIIDQDYCGHQDELLIQVTNISGQIVNIAKGTRIAQGVIVPMINALWKEVPLSARNLSRGGFGSTGVASVEARHGAPLPRQNIFPAIDTLTEEEKAKVAPFVSNMDSSIFALKHLPQEVSAALFSRYSRASGTLKEILVREFLKDANLSELIGGVSSQNIGSLEDVRQKADNFFKKVLAAYGDESVAELGGAHLAIENVSMLAIETLEKPRIGLSPLEKSTRYVEFDEQWDNRYRYYRDPKLMQSIYGGEYIQLMDRIFSEYSFLLEKMKSYFKQKFPQDQETSDRAYASTIRAKACDVLRLMLPMSTQANLGFFGNGRAFEYLINRLLAHPLTETSQIGQLSLQELEKVIPSFVRRPKETQGLELQAYLKKQARVRRELYYQYYQDYEQEFLEPAVNIVRYDVDAEVNIIASSMFSESNLPLAQLKNIARNMTFEEQSRFITKAAADRKNRFEKLSRAFEAARYEIEIIGDIGVFKDFKRHRICSQERQPYSTLLGFVIPKEIIEIGAEDAYRQIMKSADTLWQKVNIEMPYESEYVIPMAYLMRDRMELSLREMAYIIELRSTPAGHPSYRFIAQEMFRQLQKIHPHFADLINCNFMEVDLERLYAEKKTDEKLKSLMS